MDHHMSPSNSAEKPPLVPVVAIINTNDDLAVAMEQQFSPTIWRRHNPTLLSHSRGLIHIPVVSTRLGPRSSIRMSKDRMSVRDAIVFPDPIGSAAGGRQLLRGQVVRGSIKSPGNEPWALNQPLIVMIESIDDVFSSVSGAEL
jgi:hypothetical protein